MRTIHGIEIKNMSDLIDAHGVNVNPEANWFSPDNMDFWETKIVSGVYAGRYFVTSDLTFDDQRAYSIRQITDYGYIDSITFQEHDSLDAVLSAVESLVS